MIKRQIDRTPGKVIVTSFAHTGGLRVCRRFFAFAVTTRGHTIRLQHLSMIKRAYQRTPVSGTGVTYLAIVTGNGVCAAFVRGIVATGCITTWFGR